MNRELKILIVDDSDDDAFIIMRALKKGSFTANCRHAKSEIQLASALEEHWDVVVSDHNMPGISSADVIQRVKGVLPETPVIVVSGSMADHVGVQAMKVGAQDYLMKNNLARLIPAITREIESSDSRKARVSAEEDLRYLAYHDTLTNLLNRQEFSRRLRQHVETNTDNFTVLMYLDLDQFKIVNDTCGHVAGDELLKQVTKALQEHIRDSDTLARLGGDEFGILLESSSKEAALTLAERIRQAIRELRFTWKNKPYTISISIGMVATNEYDGPVDALLSAADIACYVAKDTGRNGIQWYSKDNEAYNQRRSELQWASKIRHSLEENRFLLHFQPMKQISTDNDGPHGEFLVRLLEDGQLVPPGLFIPAAEKYNLMPLVDRWVLDNAFKYLAETGLGKKPEGTFFINLSGNTLSDPAFFDDVRTLLKKHQIHSSRICLEITETAAIANLTDAVGFISEIRDEGFKFALDDFGVGMSSFSYLKTIPVDYLKIDGSFVLNMLKDPIDQGIVEACNQVSHRAGLKTIAEFVENEDIEEALRIIGVDFAQGFGIAKPGPLKGK